MRLDGEGVDEQGRFRNNCGIEERKRKIIKNIWKWKRQVGEKRKEKQKKGKSR